MTLFSRSARIFSLAQMSFPWCGLRARLLCIHQDKPVHCRDTTELRQLALLDPSGTVTKLSLIAVTTRAPSLSFLKMSFQLRSIFAAMNFLRFSFSTLSFADGVTVAPLAMLALLHPCF
jgi:hypothetical protein